MTGHAALPAGRHDAVVPRLLALAWTCLALHAVLSIFSAVAFATFLSSPPAWLQSEASQRALVIGWRYGPATTVVLGAFAALVHALALLGARKTFLMFAMAFVVAFTAEYVGTWTGYPFGPYTYSSLLGYRIGGRVPFNIPTSWFYMLYASLALTGAWLGRAGGQRLTAREKWRWALVGGAILTAWDVSLDPAMVRTHHWTWQLDTIPDTVFASAFLSDLFYGMPLLNWFGWLLTGTIIARLMLAIVPAPQWTARVSPTRLPMVLYLVNGVLPITICVRHEMYWAAALGTVAMLIPVVAALRPPVYSANVRDVLTNRTALP